MSHLARRLLLALLLVSAGRSVAAEPGSGGRPIPAGDWPPGEVARDGPRHFPIRLAARERAADSPQDPGPSVVAIPAVTVSGPAAPHHEERLPLPPPSRSSSLGRGERTPPTTGGMLTTVVGSLTVVLGVFFVFLWITRRAAPQGMMRLPNEAVESLGRAPLAGRQQMQLLRVGRKLVLLSVTSTDARTLTEITDPDEVDRLAGLCQQARPGSVTSTFRQVLAHCAGEPAARSTTNAPNADARDQRAPSFFGRGSREIGHA